MPRIPAELVPAYAYCERLARAHYENFPIAARLLAAAMRPHVAAIYAFARTADDIADKGDLRVAERYGLLDAWVARLRAVVRSGDAGFGDVAPVFQAIGHTVAARGLRVSLLEPTPSSGTSDSQARTRIARAGRAAYDAACNPSPFTRQSATDPMREADEGREPPHSAPPAALVTGSVVASRYEILGLVGEGGMGVVYRARDRSLDEVVAIKVLRPQLVGSPQMAQRFRAEIKLARRVTHRNVCRIHDYGEDGSLAFISMELVEGVDLKRLVREQRDLSPDETFDVALQLADGLQAIHDEGIIHRDFKTANVMIDRRGTVRLMDFGIAKLWETESAEGLTLQGQTAGTPEYMSPEQASGQALDPRSEIYSLDVVLFEQFTGIRPFAADHVAAVIYKQVHDEPTWSAPRASALPPPCRQ